MNSAQRLNMRLLSFLISICLFQNASTNTKAMSIHSTRGMNVILDCSVKPNWPTSWKKRNSNTYITIAIDNETNPSLSREKFLVKGNKDVGEYNLEIRNISDDDEGIYACSIIDVEAGQFQRTIYNLSVNDSLVVKIEYKNLTERSYNKTLKCIPYGYPDNYSFFYWEHRSDYGDLIRTFDGSSDGLLSLNDKSPFYYDNGFYTCYISDGAMIQNRKNKPSSTVYLTVSGTPVFIARNKRKYYGKRNMVVDIAVDVFSSPRYTTLTIRNEAGTIVTDKPNSTRITDSPFIIKDSFFGSTIKMSGYRVTLTVRIVSTETTAVYTFYAENRFGASNLTVTLEIEESNFSPIEIKTIVYSVAGSVTTVFVYTIAIIYIRFKRKSQLINNNKDKREDPLYQNNPDSIGPEKIRAYSTQSFYENVDIESNIQGSSYNSSAEYLNTVFSTQSNGIRLIGIDTAQEGLYGNIEGLTYTETTSSMAIPINNGEGTEYRPHNVDIDWDSGSTNSVLTAENTYHPLMSEDRTSMEYDPLCF